MLKHTINSIIRTPLAIVLADIEIIYLHRDLYDTGFWIFDEDSGDNTPVF